MPKLLVTDRLRSYAGAFRRALQVARKLDDIAFQLTEKMGNFTEEMAAEIQRS